jgi:hypothetical protein
LAQINHTNRLKITRNKVRIQLHKHFTPWQFSVSLDIGDLNLADDDRIVVEATHSIITERFGHGTVDAPYPVTPLELTELTGRPNIHFRIKVIAADGSGLIAAEADQIPVTGSSKSNNQQISILEYDESVDRPLPWWLDWNGGSLPVLVFNPDVHDVSAFAKSDMYRGSSAAAVVEQVLTRMCFVDETEDYDEDDEQSWQTLWLDFIRQLGGDEFNPQESEPQQKHEWIAKSVELFASRFRPISKLNLGLRR